MTSLQEIRANWGATLSYTLPHETYPDGLPLVTAPPYTEPPVRLLVRPSSVHALMTALWYVDALRDRGFAAPELILPHVPGSRQDRLNPTGDYLFTLKSVAREINLRQFPKVTVLDPHSDVTPALVERCEVVHIWDIITGSFRDDGYQSSLSPLSQYDAVISPDGGAEKRAGKVATMLNKPLIHAWKTRDVQTGAISGFGVEGFDDLAPRRQRVLHVLVVDDICDGGGTFVGLAKALGVGAGHLTADLWTTHGFYTKGTQPLLDAGYRRLFTTDSIVRGPQTGCEVLTVCDTLLQKGTL